MVNITKTPLFIEECSSFILPDHDTWKEKIKNIVKIERNKEVHKLSTTPEKECNVKGGRTAWDSHYRYPAVLEVAHKIMSISHASVLKDGFDAPKLSILNSWINWYDKNQYTDLHNHPVHIAVVYFVDTEHSTSDFFFHTEDKFQLIKKNKDTLITNQIKKITVKDGTVIFFNGGLHHSVTPNLSDKTRITFAMNLTVDYWGKRENY